MIKTAAFLRPARLEGLYLAPSFIPPNSKDYLIEVDLGFKINPVYKQEKLCFFLPDNVYYQKLVIVDGKGNAIKDDARTIVVTGKLDASTNIRFDTEIFPPLAKDVKIDPEFIQLPIYPEINSEIVIKENGENNFHHFSCNKIIYKTGSPYLQLRYLGNYYGSRVAAVLKKWHPVEITHLQNIPS